MTKWKYSLHTFMLLIASAAACFGQKSYTLTPINSGGQALSLDWISDDASTAFGWEIHSNPFAGPCVIYQNGAATAITTPGFPICQPVGANNNGTYLLGLSGTLQSGTTPAVATYANGQFHFFTVPAGLASAQMLSGGINKQGQVIATFSCKALQVPIGLPCAFLSGPDGTFRALAPSALESSVGAINDSGDAAGWIRDSTSHAVIWSHTGRMIDLNSLLDNPLSAPIAINSKGQVLLGGGWCFVGDCGGPFFYDGQTVTTIQVPGASRVYPVSLNDNGEVVGYYYTKDPYVSRSFYWSNGQAVDLNTVIQGAPNGTFTSGAAYINNAGQILAGFVNTNNPAGLSGEGLPAATQYILTPSSLPAPEIPPTITGVVNSASFWPGTSSGALITIEGTNLSQATRQWNSSNVVDGNLPTSLDGVSVTVDGLNAYVTSISPLGIDILAPADSNTGPVQVQVTTSQGTSAPFTVNKSDPMPSFFMRGSLVGSFVMATHADGTLVAPPGSIPGAASGYASPGETISLYGTGFGPAVGSPNLGQVLPGPLPLSGNVTVTVGGEPCTVTYAGMIAPGLDQINIVLPNVTSSWVAIEATVNGVFSLPKDNLMLPFPPISSPTATEHGITAAADTKAASPRR
jgi:uncharacterized protein (TIGR03437 family)